MTPVAKRPEINVKLSMEQLTALAQIVANFMTKQNQPDKKEELELMTTKEACDFLHLCPASFSRICKKNGIEPARTGKPNLYDRKDIHKLLN